MFSVCEAITRHHNDIYYALEYRTNLHGTLVMFTLTSTSTCSRLLSHSHSRCDRFYSLPHLNYLLTSCWCTTEYCALCAFKQTAAVAQDQQFLMHCILFSSPNGNSSEHTGVIKFRKKSSCKKEPKLRRFTKKWHIQWLVLIEQK